MRRSRTPKAVRSQWLVAGLLLLFLVAISLPSTPSRINRAVYNSALAQWRAQNIEEYEITTEEHAFLGGTETLRVSDHGNKIEIIGSSGITTPERPDDYKPYTVEGLFADIDRLVQEDQEIHSVPLGNGEVFTLIVSWSATFDPVFGYPNYVASAVVDLLDSDQRWTVTNFKILKQGLPAVP